MHIWPERTVGDCRRACSIVCAAMSVLLYAGGSVWGDVVVVKRSPEMAIGIGLDARFSNPIAAGTIEVYSDASTGQDMVDDTYLRGGGFEYKNYGASDTVLGSAIAVLTKFNLNALPGFAGGHVVMAQLRLYYNAGNTGLNLTGQVTSMDWAEGDKNSGYPGTDPAAPGASAAHPAGLNTSESQDAEGLTVGPLQSWADDAYFDRLKDGSWDVVGRTETKCTVPRPDGSDPTGDAFIVMNVTAMVQDWADGKPNYGFFTSQDTYNNCTVQLSETSHGGNFQPVLAIEYVQNGPPEAVTDLTAADVDWCQLHLSWTAPSDQPPGPIASYDLRYSQSPIDESNFDEATPVANLPAPAVPGSAQDVWVMGLQPETRYYLAMRCIDVAGLNSGLSNVLDVTTTVTDSVSSCNDRRSDAGGCAT